MTQKEFMGHIFCDSRFENLRQLIKSGPLDKVLEVQELNNHLNKNRYYNDIKLLLSERLK